MKKASPIFIPTRGRAGKITTVNALSPKLRKNVVLVVRSDEFEEYQRAYPYDKLLRLPKHVEGIHKTRQWILQHCIDTNIDICVMYDDDITSFGYKPEVNKNRILRSKPAQIYRMDFNMRSALVKNKMTIGMVGSSDRMQGGLAKKEYADNARCCQIMYINVPMANFFGWRYDRVKVMGDMDFNMQVVGCALIVRRYNKFIHNLKPEGWEGGCALYRTRDMRREAYEFIARKFNGYIDVDWDNLTHRINWNRLYKDAKKLAEAK